MSYADERRLSHERGRTAERYWIETRVPSKYRLVDLETGDVWKIDKGRWRRASAAETIGVLVDIGREPKNA